MNSITNTIPYQVYAFKKKDLPPKAGGLELFVLAGGIY
jgi:hypothetical protein